MTDFWKSIELRKRGTVSKYIKWAEAIFPRRCFVKDFLRSLFYAFLILTESVQFYTIETDQFLDAKTLETLFKDLSMICYQKH